MGDLELTNQTKDTSKKPGRKVELVIPPKSPEDLLNTLADIIIERIIEEKQKKPVYEPTV